MIRLLNLSFPGSQSTGSESLRARVAIVPFFLFPSYFILP
jgi:hypothetical protein